MFMENNGNAEQTAPPSQYILKDKIAWADCIQWHKSIFTRYFRKSQNNSKAKKSIFHSKAHAIYVVRFHSMYYKMPFYVRKKLFLKSKLVRVLHVAWQFI